MDGLLVMKPTPSQFVLSIEAILRYPTMLVLGKGRMICMHYKNEILYAFLILLVKALYLQYDIL